MLCNHHENSPPPWPPRWPRCSSRSCAPSSVKRSIKPPQACTYVSVHIDWGKKSTSGLENKVRFGRKLTFRNRTLEPTGPSQGLYTYYSQHRNNNTSHHMSSRHDLDSRSSQLPSLPLTCNALKPGSIVHSGLRYCVGGFHRSSRSQALPLRSTGSQARRPAACNNVGKSRRLLELYWYLAAWAGSLLQGHES